MQMKNKSLHDPIQKKIKMMQLKIKKIWGVMCFFKGSNKKKGCKWKKTMYI